ncbi:MULTISPECIES: hypothetical protein [Nostocales]|nr:MULTISPECIES: hypothetical protein [Nostocales]
MLTPVPTSGLGKTGFIHINFPQENLTILKPRQLNRDNDIIDVVV